MRRGDGLLPSPTQSVLAAHSPTFAASACPAQVRGRAFIAASTARDVREPVRPKRTACAAAHALSSAFNIQTELILWLESPHSVAHSWGGSSFCSSHSSGEPSLSFYSSFVSFIKPSFSENEGENEPWVHSDPHSSFSVAVVHYRHDVIWHV